MKVTLIDSMGTDLTIVNAARVSFAKQSTWGRNVPTNPDNPTDLSDRDKKLVKYLAEHNHWSLWSPFTVSYQSACLCCSTTSEASSRSCMENEVSRRYVDDEPEFYIPKE